jgi:hypothetical protein
MSPVIFQPVAQSRQVPMTITAAAATQPVPSSVSPASPRSTAAQLSTA